MDRRTAESMLRGDRTGHPLDRLLTAAKAPAVGNELAGEAAAMAAFRAAAHSPTPVVTRRPSMIKLTLAKLLTVKIAAVAFATTATVGGVALAASTGALPNPIGTAKPSASVSKPADHPKPSGSALPRPSGSWSALPDGVAQLCREFDRRGRDDRGRALDDARFGELVKRAGKKDRDRVERFCGIRPSGAPSGAPTGTPSGAPSGWPGTRPDHDGDQRPDGDGQWSAKPRPSLSASGSARPRG